MKKLFFLFLLTPFLATSQDKPLLAEGVSPNLYVTHKVQPKENYYSVGRIYNISPKEIAPFNNLQLEKGLSLGQVIKIPLSASNFSQSGTAATDEVFVPVYYIVKEKEGLFRVALNHYDLPLETLKQWNNINGDVVKNGTKLIIGYLKVKKDQSALAKNGTVTLINSAVVAAVKTEEKIVVKDNPGKIIPAEEKITAPVNPQKAPLVNEQVVDITKKEPIKQVKETMPVETKVIAGSGKEIIGGAFKNLYDSQIKNAETIDATGTAGVFKSTSGWADKKYYCLHNSASPGIIIKITNPSTGKFIYAKVLDLMPDIKQNNGLLICVSNAAAAELGAAENNFNCLLNYAK